MFVIALGLLLAGCSSQPELPRLLPDATILAFGDSLTYGSGAGRDESYPAVLSQLTGFEVINAGAPGEMTGDGLRRLPELLDEHLPQLMILCHGGNDMIRKQDLNMVANNLRAMIRMAQGQGVSVMLIAVPRPGVFLSSPDFYGQIADEMKIPVERDVLSNILSDRALKFDTIHPNSRGYAVLAEAVFQLMKEAGVIQ